MSDDGGRLTALRIHETHAAGVKIYGALNWIDVVAMVTVAAVAHSMDERQNTTGLRRHAERKGLVPRAAYWWREEKAGLGKYGGGRLAVIRPRQELTGCGSLVGRPARRSQTLLAWFLGARALRYWDSETHATPGHDG